MGYDQPTNPVGHAINGDPSGIVAALVIVALAVAVGYVARRLLWGAWAIPTRSHRKAITRLVDAVWLTLRRSRHPISW